MRFTSRICTQSHSIYHTRQLQYFFIYEKVWTSSWCWDFLPCIFSLYVCYNIHEDWNYFFIIQHWKWNIVWAFFLCLYTFVWLVKDMLCECAYLWCYNVYLWIFLLKWISFAWFYTCTKFLLLVTSALNLLQNFLFSSDLTKFGVNEWNKNIRSRIFC